MFERLMFFWLVVVCVFFAAACENVEPTVSSRQATTTATDIFLSPVTRTIERFVPRRSTLAGLLEDHSFDRAEAHTFINAVRDVFDPRRVESDAGPSILRRPALLHTRFFNAPYG